MVKKKRFVIRVSQDCKRIEFRIPEMAPIIPMMPFERDSRSNVSAIANHIKQMVEKEGYNQVVCMDNDLMRYREVIAALQYIEGLEIKFM